MAKAQSAIDAAGTQVAFVFQEAEDEAARRFFGAYGLEDAPRFSDPALALYRAFGLRPGTAGQLMGFRSLARGFRAFRRGHRQSRPTANVRQMPGVALVRNGRLVRIAALEYNGEPVDYAALGREAAGPMR